jgi:hypothetical protein
MHKCCGLRLGYRLRHDGASLKIAVITAFAALDWAWRSHKALLIQGVREASATLFAATGAAQSKTCFAPGRILESLLSASQRLIRGLQAGLAAAWPIIDPADNPFEEKLQ